MNVPKKPYLKFKQDSRFFKHWPFKVSQPTTCSFCREHFSSIDGKDYLDYVGYLFQLESKTCASYFGETVNIQDNEYSFLALSIQLDPVSTPKHGKIMNDRSARKVHLGAGLGFACQSFSSVGVKLILDLWGFRLGFKTKRGFAPLGFELLRQ